MSIAYTDGLPLTARFIVDSILAEETKNIMTDQSTMIKARLIRQD